MPARSLRPRHASGRRTGPFFAGPALAFLLLAGLVLASGLGCAKKAPPLVEIGHVGSLIVAVRDNGDVVFTATNEIEVFPVVLPAEKREEAADKLARVFSEGRDWCEAHRTREVPVWGFREVRAKASFVEDGSTFFFLLTLGEPEDNRKRASVALSEERATRLLDLLVQAPELRQTILQGF
jgi:hypothetical protein